MLSELMSNKLIMLLMERLNPCCSGRCSVRAGVLDRNKIGEVLILVVVEDAQ